MKTTIEKVERKHGSSFSVIAYTNPYFAAPLHIHPEYELILIEEGGGLNFVGDSIRKMQVGDFMFIGSNLPHLWLSSDEYYEAGTTLKSRSIYTQFNVDIFPENMFNIPELAPIDTLIKASEKGVLFLGDNIDHFKKEFRELVDKQGFDKWYGLCKLLHGLSTQCRYELLTSETFTPDNSYTNNSTIAKVHLYINRHYQEELNLEDIANFVGMNPSALCRYYKRHTGKKMFEYLSGLRISYAMKLLMNRNINISQVAYDCGYNSLSHFNRQFKEITGYTSTEYIKHILHLY